MTKKFLHDAVRARVGAEPKCPIVPDAVVNRVSGEFCNWQYQGLFENIFRAGYQLRVTPDSLEDDAAELSHPALETPVFISLMAVGNICARHSGQAFSDIPLKFIWIDWEPKLVSEPMYQELIANDEEYTLVGDDDFCELHQIPVGQQFYSLSSSRAYIQLEEYPRIAGHRTVLWVHARRIQCEILSAHNLESMPVLRVPRHALLDKWPQLINGYQVLSVLKYAAQYESFDASIYREHYDKVGTRYVEKNERPQTYAVIVPVCEIQDFFKVLSDKAFLTDLIEFQTGLEFIIPGAFVPLENGDALRSIDETRYPKLRLACNMLTQKLRMESPCAGSVGVPGSSSELSIPQVQKRLQVLGDNLYVGFTSHEHALHACGAN